MKHSGRGDSGNLRNFAAMNPDKLRAVNTAIINEANDPEAMAAVSIEFDKRFNVAFTPQDRMRFKEWSEESRALLGLLVSEQKLPLDVAKAWDVFYQDALKSNSSIR